MSAPRSGTEERGGGGDSEALPPLGARVAAVQAGRGASGARPWLITLLAGLIALALGLGLGVVAGLLLDDGDDDGGAAGVDEATPAAPAGADPAGDGSQEVVPQRCLDAVELADDGLVLLDRAISSVGDLDPGELDAVLQSAEALRPDLERAIEDCRADL